MNLKYSTDHIVNVLAKLFVEKRSERRCGVRRIPNSSRNVWIL